MFVNKVIKKIVSRHPFPSAHSGVKWPFRGNCIKLTVFSRLWPYCFFLLLFNIPLLWCEKRAVGQDNPLPFSIENNPWVDSVMGTLSPDERISQLFMVAAYSDPVAGKVPKPENHFTEIDTLIKNYKIGGLIFFQGGPQKQAELTNYYQSVSKTPLLIAIDGEWGLAMRLDSTVKYPRQMMLGAISDDSLIYKMGADIAQQCKRIGIHINFAPVVDINNNPKNPVIGSRSFGENKENVVRKGIAYMRGLQDNSVLATVKHFPGHGDTDKDSHKELPSVKYSRERLDKVELYPFRELFREGAGSVMVAHLYVPVLDSTPNLASTLSRPVVTDLLKSELGYRGLVFTDALNMKGVSSYYKPGEVDLKALLAGNDVLLFAEDIPEAIKKIKEAVDSNLISQEEIDSRCRKILSVKQWAGLDKYRPISLENIFSDLNTPLYELTRRKLIESSITLLKNENDLIPLKRLDTLKIASVCIGESGKNAFQETLERYTAVTHFTIGRDPAMEEIVAMINSLDSFNLVIVGIHKTNENPNKNFGIAQDAMSLAASIKNHKKVILAIFGNPYSLSKFKGVENMDAIVISYEDMDLIQDYSAQLIFGGIGAKGKLPVSASSLFPEGSGLQTKPSRLKYTIPEEVGINSAGLEQIDTLIFNGIKEQAFPGCQVFFARDGKVFYHKTFGYHTYENKIPVKSNDIYDIASITKIAASTLSAMKLFDEGELDLEATLKDYIPEWLDTTPYRHVILRDMLAHQAGFIPFVPFYEKTMNKGQPRPDVYNQAKSETFPHRVAENFYIRKDYPDTMMRIIISKLKKPPGEYKYSDVGYYFLQKIIEKQTSKPLNDYVQENFYRKMGTNNLTYRPREKFPLDKIIPTEYDMLFRKQLVQGDVHDPGAAMFGGVGGHAGLFSNTNDLGKLMQMFLNGGEYGGERYINKETIGRFTQCQFCKKNNRRGAGFDKPAVDGINNPVCDCASLESFGHTGFTGTIAWADPKMQLVYVFLSNRVYPNADNNKLLKMGIRSQIMQVVYDALNGKTNVTGNGTLKKDSISDPK